MSAALKTTRQFEKDLRKARDRGKDVDTLWAVVKPIQDHELLPARYRPHKLSGGWKGFWECHLEPDWLLIWLDEEHTIVLVRTGTHADLFS
ncbi:MAG: type II toxin-antitoxin system YafQ family toxin [Magnetococcales bacterium]|nr:type II toxin-antitoxin system YafQ family toxin [Magnetococcales bacterium]